MKVKNKPIQNTSYSVGYKKVPSYFFLSFFLFCRIVRIWVESAPKIPVSCTLLRIFNSVHSERHLEKNGQIFL